MQRIKNTTIRQSCTIRVLLLLGYVARGGVCEGNEVGRGNFDLQPTHAGTDVDVWKVATGVVDVDGEGFLESYGRASASYVAGSGQELFHSYHLGTLVARYFGSALEVDLGVSGYNTDKYAGAVASQYECLEYLLYGLAQLMCHVVNGKVVFVNLVGYQLVVYTGLVEQASGVGLIYFHRQGVAG